jgi:hypothetical protein
MNLPDNVTREELFAMVVWLAGYQDKLNDLRYSILHEGRPTGDMEADAIKYVNVFRTVLMEWPIIQGSQHQIWLKRIGELEFDNAACGRSLKALGEPAAQEAYAKATREKKP